MTVNHEKTSKRIIQSFEADQLRERPFFIRIADQLTTSFGGIGFFTVNLIVFIIWIVINLGYVPGIAIFDPFPFILLTMAVSLEAIFLSIIVLMSQTRQGYVSTLREELDMQVNLIAEREITKSLKLLRLIANKLKVRVKDEELEEMLEETDISYIHREIQDQLKENTKTKRSKK